MKRLMFTARRSIEDHELIEAKKRNIFDSVNMKDNVIMRDIGRLPENYYIFKNVHVRLNKPVKDRGTQFKEFKFSFILSSTLQFLH